ncbi:positive regulation of myeloid dendritic cell activation [Mactra antiquata]
MMLLLTIVSTQILLGACDLGCPVAFVLNGTSCYHFSHDQEEYTSAMDICTRLDSYLAEVDSTIEGAFLSEQAHNNNRKYWIGLSDILEEGVWRWNINGDPPVPEVLNWAPQEPNNWNPGNENCVVIKNDGHWGDYECKNYFQYICETEAQPTGIIG